MDFTNTTRLSNHPLPSDEALYPALVKIVMLLTTGLSVHFALTPPQHASPKTVVSGPKTLFERGILWIAFYIKTMVWIETLLDGLATCLVASSMHHSTSLPLPTFTYVKLLQPYLAGVRSTPSLALTLGALLCLLGSLLRQWCFHELGRFFTFEVTIQPKHKLITSGPYSLARHPSYTGIYLTLLGSSMVTLAHGSLIRCMLCTTGSWQLFPAVQAIVTLLVAFWLLLICYAMQSTYKRLSVEDQALHELFGETWEDYARQVPRRLVPRVY